MERSVVVPAGDVQLAGDLAMPAHPVGMVAFAHGSGSSRHSPRNRQVAAGLNERGLATLLFDLLTSEEDERDRLTAELRFDIDLLAGRLVAAVEWLREHQPTADLPIGLFGASTGAAAALIAAARRPVDTVVSRGGRPDLAGHALADVRAPTLLIVGGRDEEVIALNRDAASRLHAPHRLEIVAGATHLFEEPGALERVTELAGEWLVAHLTRSTHGAGPR